RARAGHRADRPRVRDRDPPRRHRPGRRGRPRHGRAGVVHPRPAGGPPRPGRGLPGMSDLETVVDAEPEGTAEGAAAEPVLRLDGVTKVFGEGPSAVTAVDGANLTVKPGE